MSDTFTIRRQVEFNHCDPAGIVFYPRYFEMISAVVERFFADGLGYSWASMGLLEGNGTPMGDISVRFHNPSRLEEWLTFDLTVKRLGRSSATLIVRCSCEDEPRFTCKATLVHANIKKGRSESWPDTVRRRMESYLTETETGKTPA